MYKTLFQNIFKNLEIFFLILHSITYDPLKVLANPQSLYLKYKLNKNFFSNDNQQLYSVQIFNYFR